MNIEVSQKVNKEYYAEYYSEWLNYKSKFKKWEHIIGFASLLFALIIYLINGLFFSYSIGFLTFGCLMVFEFYYSRHKWLKARMKSIVNNNSFKVIFTENETEVFGQVSEDKAKLQVFNILKTKKGIILDSNNGNNIYLQHGAFKNEIDIEEVLVNLQKFEVSIVYV